MADKTSYAQSLTHMIKGNLGAGILAMPASFAHTGLVGAIVGLPLLCLVSAYCVHLLIKSSELLASKCKHLNISYSSLARQSFETGPSWLGRYASAISRSVDGALLVTQVGVCCVYIIFVVDNLISILATYDVHLSKAMAFLAVFPVALALSMIRTLNRLALASLVANLLQVVGLALIVEYLSRDLGKINLHERDNFRPISEMALGFGSAMFAFEGISVVLPVYSRMRTQELMASHCGVINVSFILILVLYFVMGLLGYLKFGQEVRDSITLNLPAEPLYDAVRAMFAGSILLTYPLQAYVPNEIIWKWAQENLIKPTKKEISIISAIKGTLVPQTIDTNGAGVKSPVSVANLVTGQQQQQQQQQAAGDNKKEPIVLDVPEMLNPTANNHQLAASSAPTIEPTSQNAADLPVRYEYYCRIVIVMITFTLAFTVPMLNLLMDLIGSFSGVLLCLTLPALIHLATYWNEMKGASKIIMVVVDVTVILLSLVAGFGGSLSSLVSIVKRFHDGQR